jgi:DNA-binding response OmpR family regulator
MPNVIVVDDDLTNVQLLQMLLEIEGYTVFPCTNIDDALQATTVDTNAFVIDWHLERNSSGLDLLKAVRTHQTQANKHTIIIMTSGDHRREKEALDSGADHFLLKPYPPDELSSILNNLLGKEGESGQ